MILPICFDLLKISLTKFSFFSLVPSDTYKLYLPEPHTWFESVKLHNTSRQWEVTEISYYQKFTCEMRVWLFYYYSFLKNTAKTCVYLKEKLYIYNKIFLAQKQSGLFSHCVKKTTGFSPPSHTGWVTNVNCC